MSESFEVHRTGSEIFWGEMPPSEHLVQVYEDESVFLDTLEGFVTGGLRAGDGVIVIATEEHLHELDQRIALRGQDAAYYRQSGQLKELIASEVLQDFMVDGWPDEARFRAVVRQLLTSARGNGRRVRAFGEMVALLWARGDQGATVRLEYLWHQLCNTDGFSLFCAYPRIGFTGDSTECISELCDLHSKVIPGVTRTTTPLPGRQRPFGSAAPEA